MRLPRPRAHYRPPQATPHRSDQSATRLLLGHTHHCLGQARLPWNPAHFLKGRRPCVKAEAWEKRPERVNGLREEREAHHWKREPCADPYPAHIFVRHTSSIKKYHSSYMPVSYLFIQLDMQGRDA
ncbi:hypothetical protein NDU88_000818 [Pleurodeles waltl]|uniref:Uncharacterized protein n=1 Tax=Pleurodeles waltl TaxID=8319 RepID=A0AAV7V640_PLEWA|nr:hypothetical protein NDU88_000818 [Pleurodeles waltl]